MNICANNI